jgi:hypothetical protein
MYFKNMVIGIGEHRDVNWYFNAVNHYLLTKHPRTLIIKKSTLLEYYKALRYVDFLNLKR